MWKLPRLINILKHRSLSPHVEKEMEPACRQAGLRFYNFPHISITARYPIQLIAATTIHPDNCIHKG
jgi:hypothetical protein